MEIECMVSAFPPPIISWKLRQNSGVERDVTPDDGVEYDTMPVNVPSNNTESITSYLGKLTIKEATYSHAGVYVCVANSSGISINETDIVRLRVKGRIAGLVGNTCISVV